MALDFNGLCRICLKDGINMVPLYNECSKSIDEVPLSAKLVHCCKIELQPNDCLPQQVCPKCAFDINVAYDLNILTQTSDSTLRKYLHIYQTLHEEKASQLMSGNENDFNPPPGLSQNDNPDNKDKRERKRKKKKPLKRVNELEIKEHLCPVCGKTFGFFCMLKEHLVTHTGERSFLCSVCGKAYGHQRSLYNHMKIHNPQRDFKCDMCTLSFYRRSHLVLHKRTHTGEKPYVCSYCNRSFAQNSYLKEHIRLHSGEKPFSCDTCGHRFARKSALIMHQRTHTGELPYTCPECYLSFSQRSQRKRHILRNHKESTAFRENGELKLREHDQFRAMLSKMKNPETSASPEVFNNGPQYQNIITSLT